MIYLDNAATTKMAPEVLKEMLPYLTDAYGNPSAIYGMGSAGKKAISCARRVIAASLHGSPEEIYFTSGGTEADNWAIKAVAESYGDRGRHIITTQIEHPAVLRSCRFLEKKGFMVTYLPVDGEGMVDPEAVENAIRQDTILISIMFANNEVGTIEPVAKIGAIARKRGILFHTDAVQAYGQLPIDVEEMGIDLLSASGHKIHGPKGVGFLYIRKSVKLPAFFHGGEQEMGLRAGTENVPAIVGLGKAAELAMAEREEHTAKERQLRDLLIEKISCEIPYSRLNGHPSLRLPGNVNFSFPFISGESLLIMLDMRGICASSGSACTAGSLNPSHVLLAMGQDADTAGSALRLTLSIQNTEAEIFETVDVIRDCVERLRSMSPSYEAFCMRGGKA